MKLYYSKGACSLATRIAIHELGLKAEFESVDLRAKKTEKGQDYWAINFKGSVPALKLNSGDTLTEGAVILQYLADTDSQHTLLPKVGELSRYHVLEWLNFAATDLHKGFSPFFNSTISDDIKENIFKPSLKRTLKFLAQHLEKQPHYLNGAQLCIADCYVFVILSWAAHIAIDLVEWPSIQKYMAKLAQRNAFQEALKEEGITLTTIDCGDACGIK